MTSDILLFVLSVPLAGVVGFAAHRANVCNVKAVEQVVRERRADMFVGFAKTVLWAMAITLALATLLPDEQAGHGGLSVSLISLTGGFVCGIGMAINGGCAFSTLSKLGDGDGAMVVTLAAFVAGAVAFGPVIALWDPEPAASISPPFDPSRGWVAVLAVALGIWAIWELYRLVRSKPRGRQLAELALARNYALPASAILMGLANGLIFAVNGSWTYTSVLGEGARWMGEPGSAPSLRGWTLFVALLLGMGLSSWQRGSFRLRLRPSVPWLRNLFGGLLMGAGASMVPGGNDVLLFHGIPTLSPHAAPA